MNITELELLENPQGSTHVVSGDSVEEVEVLLVEVV